jgi:hypothetical protein
LVYPSTAKSQADVRAIVALGLLSLALPGSNYLFFDGLPVSKPLEFLCASLIIFALLARSTRDVLAEQLFRHSRLHQWLKLLMVVVVTVKVVTFFWMPFSGGFEACYRSIYSPLPPSRCEKSYESWWGTPRSSLGTGNISRVDDSIDFGPSAGLPSIAGMSDSNWNLPFVNDYPRLSDWWIDRMPFNAKFGAIVETKQSGFLPIHGSGEFNASVGGSARASDGNTSYAHDQALLLPVPIGSSELRIDYTHADTLQPEIPDDPPVIRGLSARLFVGEVISRSEVERITLVHLRLVVFDQEAKATPDQVVILDESQSLVASADPTERNDFAEAYNSPWLKNSGFDFAIPLERLTASGTKFAILASFEGKRTSIGELQIEVSPSSGILSQAEQVDSRWTAAQFSNWLSINTALLEPLRPATASLAPHGLLLQILVIAINGWFFLMIAAGAALIVIRRARELLISFFVILVVLVPPFSMTNLPLLSSSGIAILWATLLIPAIYWIRWYTVGPLPLAAFSSAVAFSTILRITERFNAIAPDSWWGRLIFMSRDSDWFVGQGYARQMLNEVSLRGGEGVFYFQPGVRYLILLSHLILGENDVLVAITLLGTMILGVLLLGRFALASERSRPIRVVLIVLTVLLINAFVQTALAGFAVAVASEYPTWVTLPLVTLALLQMRDSRTPRIPLVAAVLAGLVPNFRPNQAGGAVALLVIILFLAARRRLDAEGRQWLEVTRIALLFIGVASLSLAHNLHYGETFLPFSSTGQLNADFSWGTLFSGSARGDVLGLVWEKVKLGLYWSGSLDINTLTGAFWLSQLVWSVCVVLLVFRRQISIASALFLLLPLAYLIPLLPYRFDSYYPRHIVIIQIAFAFGAIGALHYRVRNENSDDESAREATLNASPITH